jgi:hypothetical protein
MQVESSQTMIRIVGLSATLPNYKDVAEFLRCYSILSDPMTSPNIIIVFRFTKGFSTLIHPFGPYLLNNISLESKESREVYNQGKTWIK